MARLNEPTAPAENIDSLKRRFIRQNRELARVNSTQSIRIRSLEGDVSRLLGENAGLQKRIIELEKTIFDGVSRDARRNIIALKERFDAKIQELTGLATELGKLNRDHTRRPSRRLSNICPIEKSPKEKQWRNRSTLSDVVAAQEGMLPTIAEDKRYPRQTLEPDDIGGILVDSSQESPDLGPPPTTFFNRERSDEVELGYEESDTSQILSANFETRKRRRDTRMIEDLMNNFSDLQSPSKADAISSSRACDPEKPIMKAGTKRKFSVEELQSSSTPSVNDNKENFSFSRKSSHSGLSGADSSQPVRVAARQTRRQESSSEAGSLIEAVTSPSRKALGPKTINIDPTSPHKAPKGIIRSNKDADRRSQATRKLPAQGTDQQRKPKPNIVRILPVQDAPPNLIDVDADPVKIEPKTPGLLDVFSPLSSQPSGTRPELRDTPPPSDLKVARTGEALEAAGRTSRRARANVSYAEPSLITKMRRPTKELADAVIREDRRSISAPLSRIKQETPRLEEEQLSVKPDSSDSQMPKQPANSADEHNFLTSEPPSPLSNKTGAATLPVSERPRKHGRRSTAFQREVEPLASAAAISTLMSTTSQKHAKDSPTLSTETVPSARLQSNGSTSLPLSGESTQAPTEEATAVLKSNRAFTAAASPPTKRNYDSSSRRQSTGTRGANPSDRNARLSTVRSVSGLNSKAAARDGATGPAGTDGLVSEEAKVRGERIAARRRSMML